MGDLLNNGKQTSKKGVPKKSKSDKKPQSIINKGCVTFVILVFVLILIRICVTFFYEFKEQSVQEKKIQQEKLANELKIRQEQLVFDIRKQEESDLVAREQERIKNEQLAEERRQQEERERIYQEQTRVIYKTYTNHYYNYSIDYPSFLIPQGESQNGDGQSFVHLTTQLTVYKHFALDEELSINEIYNQTVKYYTDNNSDIVYKVQKTEFFVISGLQNDNIFYRRTIIDNKSGRYLTGILIFDKSQKELFDEIISHIFSSMKFN